MKTSNFACFLLPLVIAMGFVSCGSNCGGPNNYTSTNSLISPATFVPIIWKNKIPRYVYYPAFNRTDSIYQVYQRDISTYKPLNWICGLYLNSKENFTTAIVKYDFGEDTLVLNYHCKIIYDDLECSSSFTLHALGINLYACTEDSIYLQDAKLFLP